MERHHRHSAEVRRSTLRLAAVGSVWEAAAFTVPLLAVTASCWLNGLAVADGRITVGALTTFVLWMGTVSVAVNALVSRLGDLTEARVAYRIARVLELPPPPRPYADVEPGGVLRLDGLTVRRPGRDPVGPLSLEARPGQWLAITGPTGCGKSTLLRAVAQLVPSGTATLGGVPLDSLDPEQLYRLVGLVPEGPVLLHGTVAENLLLPGPRTPDDMAEAARTAGLGPDLSSLAEGLDTPVGERGGALSGGQRQRVALARALLRDSPVLLLDDVTSALDDATEAEVLDRLRDATADRIVILCLPLARRPRPRRPRDHPARPATGPGARRPGTYLPRTGSAPWLTRPGSPTSPTSGPSSGGPRPSSPGTGPPSPPPSSSTWPEPPPPSASPRRSDG